MKIHFLGGSDEVGASCILVEIGGQRILVDAGIRVSPKASGGLSGELLPDLSPLNDGKLDAVIITHAHADHIGAIPLVVGAMPDVPVYSTPATLSLMSVMFRDALRIMDSRLEAEGELPTYDILQVQRVEAAARPVDFKQEFSVNGKVNITFFRAGHIPGAASVFMQSDKGSILISGDLSFSAMRATPVAEIPPVRPDVLLLETTYGGKLHANRRAEEQRLIESVRRVIDKGGRILIPAFALGRAQEVALILDNAVARKKMPSIPIYMDGMTRSITQVFERFPDYLSRELKKQLEDEMNIFRSDAIQYVKDRAQREQLAMGKMPAVIISSSGMLTGGASPFYAQHIIKEKNSAIFITGYQDEESPGRTLQTLAEEGGGTLTLYGKKMQLECEIGTYSLSAHADENELTQFAAQLEPKHVYLVHGDRMPRERMRELLMLRKLFVRLPRLGEEVEVEGSAAVGRRRDLTQIPIPAVMPITSIEELNVGLPIFDPAGEIYVTNAKKAIRKLLPPETGLRKMTFEVKNKTIHFTFDFPDVARVKYVDQVNTLRGALPGWTIELNEYVNQDALNQVAKRMIPSMVGRVSVHMMEKVVEVKMREMPRNWADMQDAYFDHTGFRILPKGDLQKSLATEVPAPVQLTQYSSPVPSTPRREINEAYGIVKNALRDDGLYKTGLKGSAIILSFITPEKGRLCVGKIEELANEVGYALDIHPHPNQHALLQLVAELCQSYEIFLVKNPSILNDQRAIAIESADAMEKEKANEVKRIFNDLTAWRLFIKTPAGDMDE